MAARNKDQNQILREFHDNYKLYIDEPDGANTYIGKTEHQYATSDPHWQIRKITVNNGVTAIQWADGDDAFDNTWDNRAALTYS